MYSCGCACKTKDECSEKSWWPLSSCCTALLAALLFLFAFIYFIFAHTKYPRGAVVANGYECAEIGGSILNKGGSAVDAAIATAFCEGVAAPSACGLGGGFFMTVHTHRMGNAEFLNAREVAPRKAQRNMYPNQNIAQKGPLAVAVPSQLRGFAAAHKRYGLLTWSELVQPTIKLCEKGIYITKTLEENFKINEKIIKKDEVLRSMFINPQSGETYKKGERLKLPKLADTLKIIADEGAEALYTGSLVQQFVKDINGIIDEEDMAHYAPQWDDPQTSTLLNDETMFTSPVPGSGILLTFIFNVLKGFIDTNINSVRTWQRIIESFKHANGIRTGLGDDPYLVRGVVANLSSEEYAKYIRTKIFDDRTCQKPQYYGSSYSPKTDKGTANICVLATNGDAVVLTTTINNYFGAGFASQSTGIILNAEMDDFSSPCLWSGYNLPPTEANFIEPGKRPLSSMSPTIVIDWARKKQLLIGAAGGPKIPTSIALTILRTLWFNETLEKAIGDHRLHHQLFPMTLVLENDYETKEKVLVTGFRQIGHEIEFIRPCGFSAVTAIYKDNDKIYAISDPRRPGSSYYLYS